MQIKALYSTCCCHPTSKTLKIFPDEHQPPLYDYEAMPQGVSSLSRQNY
ncbi:hypothetical protein MC7420_1702 [Coleofasciculus chthonoplastes PCC 7420]|uniref:Uncharacterized protein n=1 Tax=Coleofasciculus chthonoplastes PCC 7420 TaxID=118168 RepID=B4VMI4_9CYAN|nr:hypothetical protein MC7420_1702 [Coleofasciculus chthonoplastes PCC 7420]